MLILWGENLQQSKLQTYLKKGLLVHTKGAGVETRVEVFNPAQPTIPASGPGDVVLGMGSEVVKFLGQQGVLRKNSSITSQRNIPHKLVTGAACLVSYSPDIVEVDYAKNVDLLTDGRMAIRLVTTGSLQPKLGTYRYVNDFSDAIAFIKARKQATGKWVPVSLDTETKGTDYTNPEGYIITVQLCYAPGRVDVVRFESRKECKKVSEVNHPLRKQLDWLFTANDDVILRLANGKYDMNWFAWMWGLNECTTFKFDTVIVGSLLDENRSNSLKVHGKIYTNMGGYSDAFDNKYDKSRMDLVPKEDLLIYGGADTDVTQQVADAQRVQLIADPELANFYITILHPAARAYEVAEQTGWCVDLDYYHALQKELRDELAEHVKAAKEILGGRIVAKHHDDDKPFNLLKASLLKDFMFSPMGLNLKPKMVTAKKQDPSTSLDHLMMFKNDTRAQPFVKILEAYSSAKKTHDTYVVGFLKHLCPDGRFHPNFFMFSGDDDWADDEGGTVTGRLSVKRPAIQTIPKHTAWAMRLRRAIIAPKGFLIAGNDYAQGELKITACLANEPTMLQAYLDGIDLHCVTGARLAGIPLDVFLGMEKTDPKAFKAIRQLAKAGNFGLIYGMGVEGFQSYAYWNYGVELSLEQAAEHHGGFFKLYNRLPDWHEKYRTIAELHGEVRSPLGRVRHLPMIRSANKMLRSKAGRQAINSPVQGTLSDMSLWAAAILWQRGSLKKAPIFGMIHDQNLRYVPEDRWEHYMKESTEVMENLPFEKVGWKPQLRFTVDAEIGPNLGELCKPAEFKLAA